MINVTPIRSNTDYEKSLERIIELMDATKGTAEGDELDVLATLVEAYEKTRFPIDAPDPIEFLKNAMEFMGLGQSDLADVLNSRSRASEILNRQRPLTLGQIRRITTQWNIPSDPLIREYEVAS